jgi:hypothetical protein
MKTILISLFTAGATAVAVIGPEFDFQNKGRGKDKDKSESTSRDHSRDTSAGTRWTEDTRPPSVPEPDSPLVLLTLAGAALLMTRNK